MKETSVDNLVARRFGIQNDFKRRSLELAQLQSFRNTLWYGIRNSPLYRERFANLDPECLQVHSDLQTIPFLTTADILEQGHRLLSVSQSRVARVITLQTSGSTGLPKRLSFTSLDLAATEDFFLHGMYSLVDQSDRILVLLPFLQQASVGELLLVALAKGGIHAEGMWPPQSDQVMAERIRKNHITCVVGLPQHLLAVSTVVPRGVLRSMLLCSDYASPSIRHRIEENCGCETFLHYGSTESGLGGAVECTAHAGCHIRESDLLIEIVDPHTGRQCADGETGEVVLTTLEREAMPLIRYRTGDSATLDRSRCACGGITARLRSVQGRLNGCLLSSGILLYSQDIDDCLFQIPGLLDYRIRLDHSHGDRLHLDFLAVAGERRLTEDLLQRIRKIPAICDSLACGDLVLGVFQQVERFAAIHTLKRTIIDQLKEGEIHAVCS
jgi:phenylacetate-CoA ligase